MACVGAPGAQVGVGGQQEREGHMEGILKEWEIAPSGPAQKWMAEPSDPHYPLERMMLGEI